MFWFLKYRALVLESHYVSCPLVPHDQRIWRGKNTVLFLWFHHQGYQCNPVRDHQPTAEGQLTHSGGTLIPSALSCWTRRSSIPSYQSRRGVTGHWKIELVPVGVKHRWEHRQRGVGALELNPVYERQEPTLPIWAHTILSTLKF